MRKITVDIGNGGKILSLSEKNAGFGGEHNAVSVCFGLNDDALMHFGGCEYYRVIAEGNYSDKLFLQDLCISYNLPQAVMIPPMIHCQLVGYAEADGELSLVAKSEVIELKIGFSEVPYKKMNAEPDVFEKALADCSEFALQAKQNAILSQSNADASNGFAKSAAESQKAAKNYSEIAVDNADAASRSAQRAEAIAEMVGEASNPLKATASGEMLVLSDVSPRVHDIKVALSGETIQRSEFTKGGSLGTVAQIFDESVYDKDWLEFEIYGSFEPYYNVVPVDNRTSLYVSIPAFAGGSAGLFFSDGTSYYTLRVCDYNGGEIYCFIDGNRCYVSFESNGGNVGSFEVPDNLKIMGVCCSGENFQNNSLELFDCFFASPIKVIRTGKNLLPYPYNGRTNGQHTRFTFTDNGDGSITINGQQNGAGNAYFDLMYGQTLFLPKGNYIGSGSKVAIVAVPNTSPAQPIYISKSFTLNADTEINRIYLSIEKSDTQVYDNVVVKPMLEKGTVATEYEPPVTPTEYTPDADGTLTVPSLYPSTRLYTDTEGVVLNAEYNRDINKAFAELTNALISLGGNV